MGRKESSLLINQIRGFVSPTGKEPIYSVGADCPPDEPTGAFQIDGDRDRTVGFGGRLLADYSYDGSVAPLERGDLNTQLARDCLSCGKLTVNELAFAPRLPRVHGRADNWLRRFPNGID
ncbi:MAG: hypothetical protein ABSD69_02895 [Candidatus Levyibacteriota bacterium]|jgi:hypothetical protein